MTSAWSAFLLLAPCVFGAIYQPHPGAVFQWQLEVDDANPFDYSMHADLYDTDLWGVTAADIRAIHA